MWRQPPRLSRDGEAERPGDAAESAFHIPRTHKCARASTTYLRIS